MIDHDTITCVRGECERTKRNYQTFQCITLRRARVHGAFAGVGIHGNVLLCTMLLRWFNNTDT